MQAKACSAASSRPADVRTERERQRAAARGLGAVLLGVWMLGVALASPASAQLTPEQFAQRRESHWAWEPLLDPAVPAVADAAWVQDPLDAFVLARLEQEGLRPAPPAEPHVWLRRVWFDLVGLPPPREALHAFVADPSRRARERVVDELLASPHHAERWARHWLDLVRYAESLGHEYDFPIPYAWRYRDYVIRAIAGDVPFDVFAKEHVAGDLIDPPRVDPATGTNESVQATAFWWFAEQTHSPVDARQHQADRIDNQIDVLTKSFLGMTVACARCHDHKFDAITSADYYALSGFLKSSRYVQQPLHRTADAAVAAVEDAHRALASAPGTATPDDGADGADGADARTGKGKAVRGRAHGSGRNQGTVRPGETVFADFAGSTFPAGWFRTGDAFGSAPWNGPFLAGRDDEALVLRTLPAGFANSAALGRDREGTLHSPTFVLEQPYLHVEVAGEGSRCFVVVDGLHLVRDPIYGKLHHGIGDPVPHWLTFDVAMWQGRSAYLQFVDQRAHDLADPDRNGKRYPDDGWVAVRRVVCSDRREAPPRDPAGTAECGERRVPLDAAARAALRAFDDARRLLPPPATLPAMADGTGEDECVFVRGSHRRPGDLAPRRFLAALDGTEPLPIDAGSGRLALAERMFADGDPLPARVFVNRVWKHLFGEGLVPTVDNLGVLGEPPTHRDLLDRLSRDAIADGWSQRRLIRRLVLSSAYAMQSIADPAAEEHDPDNALLHRQRLRRLEGEPLRDALLALADRLDATPFGPSVPVSLHGQPRARGRPRAGPIDGSGRRSVYLAVHRNFLPELLCAFDLPTPFTTIGARSESNVPAQALTMLNDPFVHSMCRLIGDHIAADDVRDLVPVAADAPDGSADEHTLRALFEAMFCRPPDATESDLCLQYLATRRSEANTEVAVWAELAHALVNKKEFQYLR